MSEAFPMLAVMAWQIVFMSAVRYLEGAPSRLGRPMAVASGAVAFGVSALVAVKTWALTVAFWWWIVSLMVAALSVLVVGAYSDRGKRAAPRSLLAVCVIGSIATAFAL